MDKLLYKSPLAEASQTGEADTLQSQLSELGLLEGDGSVVDQLSSEAPDLSLEGQFRAGEYFSGLYAEELEELANSSLEALPLFRVDERYSERGYYEISSATVEPVQARDGRVYVWDLDLTKRGTKKSEFRAIETNPRQADHEFGNDVEPLIGIPSTARKTLWYDAETGDRERAEPADTVDSEFGEMDLYDLEDCGWYEFDEDGDDDAPTLLYSVPHADEAPTDCKVYDTRGQPEKYLENGDGRVRVWQSVFSTAHDSDETLVLDNGVIRICLDDVRSTLEVGADETHEIDADESEWYNTLDVDEDGHLSIDEDGHLELAGGTGRLQAERWDDSTESWTDVDIETTQWTVWDVDVRSIGMVRDRVQVTFVAEAGLFTVDLILQAGHEDVLVTIPDGETGPIPEGLETLLEPIAAETVVDVQASKTLVSRSDVAR